MQYIIYIFFPNSYLIPINHQSAVYINIYCIYLYNYTKLRILFCTYKYRHISPLHTYDLILIIMALSKTHVIALINNSNNVHKIINIM